MFAYLSFSIILILSAQLLRISMLILRDSAPTPSQRFLWANPHMCEVSTLYIQFIRLGDGEEWGRRKKYFAPTISGN